MLKLVYSQIFKNRLKKCVKEKQNQKSSESLYSVKNIDIFQKVNNLFSPGLSSLILVVRTAKINFIYCDHPLQTTA